MDNLIKKLFSRTAIFTAGKFISKILVVLMLPLYTGYLTTAQYSTADLITNTANLIIPIACLGINEGIFRNAAVKSDDPRKYFTNGLIIFGISGAGFLLLSPLLLLLPFFGIYTWLIIAYVLISNVHAICSQYICAEGHEKLYAAQGIINTALTVGLNILFLVFFGWNVTGYVLSIILADAVTSLILVVVCRLPKAFRKELISRSVMREMLRFSLPLIPTTVFWWITGVSDRYLVTWLCDSDTNGLYAVAYKIPTLLLYVVTIINDAWRLSAVEASGDIEKCRKLYDNVFRYYAAIIFTGGAVLIMLSKPLAALLFSDSFGAAWSYIPVLVVATVCSAFDSFFGSVYYTTKHTMYSFITAMTGAVMNIILNIIMIPVWGAMGASVATFISYLTVLIIRAVTVRKFISFRLHPWLLTTNLILLSGLAAIMTCLDSMKYALIISSVLAVVMIAVNLRLLYRGALSIIHGITHK